MLFLGVFLLALTPALGANLLSVATRHGCGKIAGLITQAGLADAVNSAHGITLFCPNDAAVDAVPPAILNALASNITLLQQVLKFHVVSTHAAAAQISNDLLLPTLEPSGAMMRMNVYDVRTVSGGLFPSVQTETRVTAEGARVLHTDYHANHNSLVHVIDRVIYPLPVENVPMTVVHDSDLTTLTTAVTTANLVSALANGNFTLFAPNDAAFGKLPAGTIPTLLADVPSLSAVLLKHVVAGVVFSQGLSDGDTFTTLGGDTLTITIDSAGVKVNGILVIRPDVPASNGVIHVIDSVIL